VVVVVPDSDPNVTNFIQLKKNLLGHPSSVTIMPSEFKP